VPEFVRGHSQGYQDAARANPTPGGAQPGSLPPGGGGIDSYQTRSGSLSTEAAVVRGNDVRCDECGKEGKRWTMRTVGNGREQQHTCRDCAPVSKERYERMGMQVSAAFTSPVEQADPAFAKGYKYATKWRRGVPLVTSGSAAFEAGLYAGMSDNPEQQSEWTRLHIEAAKRYQNTGFTRRLSMSREFSKQAVRHMGGMRVVGCYLRAVPEPLQATAATTMDLDSTSPSTSPSPTGSTPINGPGTKPILQGGTDPAREGGPSPYNAAPPYGTPAVPNRAVAHGVPTAIDTSPGGPVDAAAIQHLSPQMRAFRRTVQANLLVQTQQGQ
jgi:hypothetical protein